MSGEYFDSEGSFLKKAFYMNKALEERVYYFTGEYERSGLPVFEVYKMCAEKNSFGKPEKRYFNSQGTKDLTPIDSQKYVLFLEEQIKWAKCRL